MLIQIIAFTRRYHEAEKLDNDYDKYNTYFANLSSELPNGIAYKNARCRLILHPRIKMYGFISSLRDRIIKCRGQDKITILHVGVFDRRDSLKGHSALLIFDTSKQIQYYYDPLAYVGDNSKINAYMAATPLIDGFACLVVNAPAYNLCIQKLIEPSCLYNSTCGLVCVLVALCFSFSSNKGDFPECVHALARMCAAYPTHMQKFMLRFAAYYNEKVCTYQ